jgi:1-deoxy-D-xylulose-5-phosphate reductoisomerase
LRVLNAVFQIRAFRPSLVSVRDGSSVSKLKEALAGMDKLPEIMVGDEGIVEVSVLLS